MFFGQVGGGQAGGGVVGHQLPQERGDAGPSRGSVGVGHVLVVRRQGAATTIGVLLASSGSSVARWAPVRGSTRSMLERSQRATRTLTQSKVRYAAGTSKRTPSTVTVPSLRRCLRVTSMRKARRSASLRGTV